MRIRCCLLLICAVTAPALADDWKLVWSDEFDTPGQPDPKKWDYEVGFIRNNEKQYYTRDRRENARVENGMLVIESRKDHFPITAKSSRKNQPEAADYTSASLTTRGKASWTYGKIEVRAKLPRGRGMWPAIWTLGEDINKVGWPTCGEIDIMEYVGFDPDVIHTNFHMKKFNHMQNTGKGGQIKVVEPWKAWHVYAIEWTPEKIDSFVDGKKYFTFENEKSGPDAWPFDKPQYLILNTAIGGGWGGQKGIDDSIFPQRFEIDSVRVYQKEAAR